MLDRTTPPPFHIAENITLNPPKEFRLNNGIPLFWFENQQLDLIHLTIKIKAGAIYETQKSVSGFCYNLLKESHPQMSAEKFDAQLDYYGTSLNIITGVNQISINVQCPNRNAKSVIEELAKLLTSPKFRQKDLAHYRAKTIKDWEYQARKVDYRTTQLMMNHFFAKDFVFGKNVEKSDFENITIKNLQDFHQETCCAENIRMFVAGNLNDEILTELCEHFAKIPHGQKMHTVPDIRHHYTPRRIHEKWEDALQTSIVLCHNSLLYNDPDIHRFRFFNSLFCNYFGSRLMQNLRERNGYTYGICGNNFYIDNGSIHYIESAVNNDNAQAAIQACFDEMKLIREELVSEEELEIVRNFLYGNALRSIDGTVQYMQNYIEWNNYGSTEQRFYDYYKTVREMTAEDVQKMANRVLKEEDFTIITVGNNNLE